MLVVTLEKLGKLKIKGVAEGLNRKKRNSRNISFGVQNADHCRVKATKLTRVLYFYCTNQSVAPGLWDMLVVPLEKLGKLKVKGVAEGFNRNKSRRKDRSFGEWSWMIPSPKLLATISNFLYVQNCHLMVVQIVRKVS